MQPSELEAQAEQPDGAQADQGQGRANALPDVQWHAAERDSDGAPARAQHRALPRGGKHDLQRLREDAVHGRHLLEEDTPHSD